MRESAAPRGTAGVAVEDMQLVLDAVMSSTGVIPIHKFLRPIKVCCHHACCTSPVVLLKLVYSRSALE